MSLPELIGLWGVQDGLLQQYRTIFITMQSIFIAVAAALLQAKEPWISTVLLTVLGVVTLYLWVTICLKRGQAVYCVQYLCLRAEQGQPLSAPIRILKEFQDGHHKEIERDPQYRALLGGSTRKKLEVVLPSLFVVAWIFLWLILLLQHYNVIVLPR
jgi:hypothetical protein